MKSFVHAHLSEILEMRKQFVTWAEIKEILNYPKSHDVLSCAFYRVAKEMDIEIPATKFSTDKYDEDTVKSWGAMKLNYSQIYLLTGLSFVSVVKLCTKYGVVIPSGKIAKPRIDKEEIQRLAGEGMTKVDIALKLGCSYKIVHEELLDVRLSVDVSEVPPSYFVPAEIRQIALGSWS